MSLVRFDNFGDITNGGLNDGIEGRVCNFMEALPKDSFFWIGEENEKTLDRVPSSSYKSGIIIISISDSRDSEKIGKSVIGLRLPDEAKIVDSTKLGEKTVFDYKGVLYEVRHSMQEMEYARS